MFYGYPGEKSNTNNSTNNVPCLSHVSLLTRFRALVRAFCLRARGACASTLAISFRTTPTATIPITPVGGAAEVARILQIAAATAAAATAAAAAASATTAGWKVAVSGVTRAIAVQAPDTRRSAIWGVTKHRGLHQKPHCVPTVRNRDTPTSSS